MSMFSKLLGLDKQANSSQPLNAASAAFDQIKAPTEDELKYGLTELQRTGLSDINLDPTGRNAEMEALSQLQGIAQAGGNDAQYRADMQNAQNAVNTNLRGQREAIMQDAAQRGTANAGTTLAAKLAGVTGETAGANQAGMTAAANADQRALQALTQSANLGSNITAQDYAQKSDAAKAQDAINAYNNQNVNEQSKYNANLGQQTFQNEMQKAQGKAGIANAQSQNMMQQGQGQTGLIGSVVGAVGSILGGKKSSGGEIDGNAVVQGDDERNDIVPALLSPGEIVLPRSVTQHPNAPELAKEFVKNLPPGESRPVHPRDVRSVLQALTEIRKECYGGDVR
jgi:hypothetical protein